MQIRYKATIAAPLKPQNQLKKLDVTPPPIKGHFDIETNDSGRPTQNNPIPTEANHRVA
jgi:hypothetical protein